MGMSDDFEVAVEEGATHVRIGRAIFGEKVLMPGKPRGAPKQPKVREAAAEYEVEFDRGGFLGGV